MRKIRVHGGSFRSTRRRPIRRLVRWTPFQLHLPGLPLVLADPGQACAMPKSEAANLAGRIVNSIVNQVSAFKNQLMNGVA